MARRLRRPMLFLIGLFVAYLLACAQLARSYLSPWRTVAPRPETVVDAHVGSVPVWATPDLARGHSSRVAFVLAHGYGGSRGTWTGLLRDLKAAGYDAVAPAMPGQDANPDKAVGFGRKEARTIRECAAWCRAQGAKRVVGVGVSLGGAATWLASQEDPHALDAVVSDASFALFSEAMNRTFSYKLPFPGGATLLRPVVWFASAMSGIDPDAIRPIEAARAWRGRPALVIQGDSDTLIVPSTGRRLAEAAECPIWEVAGAGHAQDYHTDPDGYAHRVVELARRLP